MKKALLMALMAACCMGTAGCGGTQKQEDSSADALFDRFLAGEVDAYDMYGENTFNLLDLQELAGEESFYHEEERVDLDNDGENELIISNPYGGMYLDVLDEKVVVFEEGQDSSSFLSYLYYEDACWIVYSDISHGGRHMHNLVKYKGSDTIADSFQLDADYGEQMEYDESSEFIYRDERITMQEYEALHEEIFKEEVNTGG